MVTMKNKNESIDNCKCEKCKCENVYIDHVIIKPDVYFNIVCFECKHSYDLKLNRCE